MSKLELGVIKLKNQTSNRLTLDLNMNQKELCQNIFKECVEKHGGYIRVTFQSPAKMRTTGPKSQNRHLNGHIQQICEDTGNEFDLVKLAVKERAIDMGYPMLYNSNGQPRTGLFGIRLAMSESDATIEQCSLLIKAVHLFAAEAGIVLREDS